ncbi:MAG: hypothetical protein IJT98_00065 [Prevotella sp.]|nr:hypothetical protein [Prevotella sp.]
MYVACDGASASGLDWLYVKGTPANTLGNVACTTDYLNAMTDRVELTPGSSCSYKFINFNKGNGGNWQNWVLPVYYSNDNRVIVLRADNWEDVKGNNSGCNNNYDWNVFVDQMNGAVVDMTVTYSAENALTISSNITTANGTAWTYSYNSSDAGVSLSGNIKVALSVSQSWLAMYNEAVVPVTSAGWATLYTTQALDFSSVTGLEAYTATVSEGTVTLTKVDNVPANTGVVLKAAEGSYVIPTIASSETDKGNLIGSTTATSAPAETGYTYYGLTVADNDNVQFNPITSGTIAAGKAFLKVATGESGVKSFNVVINGMETGIASLPTAKVTSNAVYNLAGQRVSTPQRGIYIRDGRKMVIK